MPSLQQGHWFPRNQDVPLLRFRDLETVGRVSPWHEKVTRSVVDQCFLYVMSRGGWSVFALCVELMSVVNQCLFHCHQCNAVNVNQLGFNLGQEPRSDGQNEIQHGTSPSTFKMYFCDFISRILFFFSLSIVPKTFEQLIPEKFLCFSWYDLPRISCILRPIKFSAHVQPNVIIPRCKQDCL